MESGLISQHPFLWADLCWPKQTQPTGRQTLQLRALLQPQQPGFNISSPPFISTTPTPIGAEWRSKWGPVCLEVSKCLRWALGREGVPGRAESRGDTGYLLVLVRLSLLTSCSLLHWYKRKTKKPRVSQIFMLLVIPLS